MEQQAYAKTLAYQRNYRTTYPIKWQSYFYSLHKCYVTVINLGIEGHFETLTTVNFFLTNTSLLSEKEMQKNIINYR
jgi:hypothetical protein